MQILTVKEKIVYVEDGIISESILQGINEMHPDDTVVMYELANITYIDLVEQAFAPMIIEKQLMEHRQNKNPGIDNMIKAVCPLLAKTNILFRGMVDLFNTNDVFKESSENYLSWYAAQTMIITALDTAEETLIELRRVMDENNRWLMLFKDFYEKNKTGHPT
jgi:flagellar biosynthesis/type III secretory pathway chaperone